ncbi:MAG: outer membrane beta-barrel protein [Saprospiraceae bacterium]
MENNLDDFFKDKLEKRNFRPRPGDWEAATQLIEEQEKDNRKRGYFFWCFGVTLLLLVASGGYWFAQPNLVQSMTTSTDETGNTTAKITETMTANQEGLTETDQRATTDATTTSKKEELNTLNNLNSTKNTTANATPRTENRQNAMDKLAKVGENSVSSNKEQQRSETLNVTTNTTSSSTQESKNSELRKNQIITKNNQTNSTNQQTKNTTNRVGGQPKKPTGNQGTASSNLSTTNGAVKEPVLADPPLTSSSEEKKTEAAANATENVSAGTANPAIETATNRSSFLLTDLPMNWLVLNSNQLALDSFQLAKNNTPITPVLRKFKWSFGLSAGTILYPHADRTQLFVGYFGGLAAKYRLNRTWSIQADLFYQQRGGDFESVKTRTGSQYSFGRRDTTFRLIPQKMHSLVLPITLQFKNGKNTIEAGFSVNYLLGVTGLVQQTESLYPWERANPKIREGVITERNTLILKDKFNTWNGSLILGYRYDLNTRWKVWGRGTYRLGEIFVANPTEGVSGYVESNPINLQIGATFYLF